MILIFLHCDIDIVGDGIFQEEYDELIVVSGIDFYSLCEHHLVPFYGKVSVGYLPHGKIVGLSKVARYIDSKINNIMIEQHIIMALQNCGNVQ